MGPEHVGFAHHAGLWVPQEYATEGQMPAGVVIIGRDVSETIRAEVRNFQGEIDTGERAVMVTYPTFLRTVMDAVRFERERRRGRTT